MLYNSEICPSSSLGAISCYYTVSKPHDKVVLKRKVKIPLKNHYSGWMVGQYYAYNVMNESKHFHTFIANCVSKLGHCFVPNSTMKIHTK